MKFITLTNANPKYEGTRVAINVDSIVTVYEMEVTHDEDKQPEMVTFVYCPPHGTWEVKESMKTVITQLNRE